MALAKKRATPVAEGVSSSPREESAEAHGIAATALALDVPVVTQDDDYVAVPGLEVVNV